MHAQQAAIREQEEATRKARRKSKAAAEKQAKMDVENDRKAEIARIKRKTSRKSIANANRKD